MGEVIPLHHAGIFGRRVSLDAPQPFVRQEVLTPPESPPVSDSERRAKRGDYLRSLPADSLTPKQAAELALINAASVAGNKEACERLLRKADQVALSIQSPTFAPVRRHGGNSLVGHYEPRQKPITLAPLIVVLLGLAALIALFPTG